MIPSASSYGFGRVVASGPHFPENDLVWKPRNGIRGRRGVVLLPGQLQSPIDYNTDAKPEQQRFLRDLQGIGTTGVCIDAGVASWGNDDAVADIELARLYLVSLGCASDKIILVGASAGVADILNYTRAHPDRVAGLVGVMPACDIEGVRTRDPGGVNARANIDTAWGMPAGSTQATDPLPARANPNTAANAAAISSSGATLRLYYSTGDTIVLASEVESFAARLPVAPTVISTTVDHSDALFGLVPRQDFLRAILEVY